MHVDLPLLRNLYQRGQLEQTAEILLAACDPKHVDAAPTSAGDSERQAWIEAMQLLGLTLHDLGRAADAADVIERVSLASPVSDEVRIALASSYAQLGRTHLAREIFLQLALSRRLPIPPENVVRHQRPAHRSAGTPRDNVFEMPGRTDPVRSLYRTLQQEIV